jgi:hypothetical protein
MERILQQMAANVQTLTTKEAKGQQVHLLCQSLIALLKGGKQ